MNDRSAQYKKGSLSLLGTVAMDTGVMIGAGIFTLTGQVAELAGGLLPIAFIVAAVVSGFSAYSYIKVASAYPSAGGIEPSTTRSPERCNEGPHRVIKSVQVLAFAAGVVLAPSRGAER